MLLVVSLCAVVTVVAGQTTAVGECTAYPGELPLNTYVEGCVEPPCQLPQLQDAVINVVFKAPRTITSMTTLANAFLPIGSSTIDIPYPLEENAVTCNHLTSTYCPLLEGEIVAYTLRMYIQPFFPVGVSVTIEFRVVDQNEEPVFCIRMPITIANAVQPPNRRLETNSTAAISQ